MPINAAVEFGTCVEQAADLTGLSIISSLRKTRQEQASV